MKNFKTVIAELIKNIKKLQNLEKNLLYMDLEYLSLEKTKKKLLSQLKQMNMLQCQRVKI